MEPPLSRPLLSRHLHCLDSPNWSCGLYVHSLLTIMKFGYVKAQGGSLKVAVYLFGSLFILLIITTTWLLGDNALLQSRGVTMNAL